MRQPPGVSHSLALGSLNTYHCCREWMRRVVTAYTAVGSGPSWGDADRLTPAAFHDTACCMSAKNISRRARLRLSARSACQKLSGMVVIRRTLRYVRRVKLSEHS